MKENKLTRVFVLSLASKQHLLKLASRCRSLLFSINSTPVIRVNLQTLRHFNVITHNEFNWGSTTIAAKHMDANDGMERTYLLRTVCMNDSDTIQHWKMLEGDRRYRRNCALEQQFRRGAFILQWKRLQNSKQDHNFSSIFLSFPQSF